ncbi:MAG: 50S ribosome-binding GTPase [candidate division Zixibacteria bacterium]|nr:50S ribosome-binding GTPase [candidate division Zixibacteria bacterium]
MIIKSFTGESTREVMKLVRSEMGGDAVVLKTRQLKDKNGAARVEITACMERHTVSQAATILHDRPEKVKNRLPAEVIVQEASPLSLVVPNSAPIEEEGNEMDISAPEISETPVMVSPSTPDIMERLSSLEQKLEQLIHLNLVSPGGPTLARRFLPIASILKGADLPPDFVADFFISCCDKYDESEDLMEYTHRELVDTLAGMMTPSISFAPGDRVMFFGHPGVGKSSVMGKLAAQLVTHEKQKVKLAGLDFQKVAAYDELAIYADLLNLEITSATEDDDEAVILIDTPAVPGDQQKQIALKKMVTEAEATHRIAVLSALMRTSDLTNLANQLESFAPTHIAVTMLDMTHRWGVIVAAARALQVPIVFLCENPGGVGTIKAPDPDRLARTLLGEEISHE